MEGKRHVMVCEDKPVTGSNIARARCYRRTELDDRGESDREQIRRPQGRHYNRATDPVKGDR